jgi:peptidoglycan/LPS O-acetylase OafA/YrhL
VVILRYRADVDGLRAIAVLPVVLFHAGIQTVSGGYVGVDIFFVISGYLISSLLLEEIRSGTFSIIAFYDRRIRRIFPALFLVLLISALAAAWLQAPADFKQFGQSVVATSLFSSNLFFWWKIGYFDTASDTKLLLHTWSLGVEEQFYIIFPVLLFLLFRWNSNKTKYYLLLVCLVSFCLSIVCVRVYPSAGFYLAPARAWELLMGSLVAFELFPSVRTYFLREVCAALGLVLILFSVFTYTPNTAFPGLGALPPCVGAALIIHSGASGHSSTRYILSSRPIVFIGLISYSLYLWHWPLIVLSRQYSIEAISGGEIAGIVCASLLIASISWRYIEQPFRCRRSIGTSHILYLGGLAACSIIVVGVFAHVTDGWPQRFSESEASISSSSQSYDLNCLSDEDHWIDPAKACDYGAHVAPAYALWGDSHAAALAVGIGRTAESYGESVKLFSYSGCPPVLGVKRIGHPLHKCIEYNEAVISLLEKDLSLHTVFLASRYAVYLKGWGLELGPAAISNNASNPVLVTNAEESVKSGAEREKMYASHLAETVRRLVVTGKKVVLVYPIPEVGYDVPKTLTKLSRRGVDPYSFARPVSLFYRRNDVVFNTLDNVKDESIFRLYPHKQLCDERHCVVSNAKKTLYSDDNHLSSEGSEYISKLFRPVFDITTRVISKVSYEAAAK